MRLRNNPTLRAKHQADNVQDYAEQWLVSVESEDYAAFQISFLEDMFPQCEVAMVEWTLPLPGFPAAYAVRVHMRAPDGVFTLSGKGNTISAALYGAALGVKREVHEFSGKDGEANLL